MKTEIYKMSALELSEAYKNKILSPVEATNSVLDRINDIDKKVNAYVFIDKELAITQAKESEIRWNKGIPKSKIDGVPSAIKDLLLTKDWPTLRGSKTVNKNIEWKDDAPVTSRLKESGAVLIGKTTTPEFGHKGTTQSPLTGITRNPWNLECTSGGSSGGSSSSVASGMGPLAIRTDGGGSVRIPCSFTGLFGINHHKAGKSSTQVDKWSAGCQVQPNEALFDIEMKIFKQAAANWGNSFTYTLLESKDI